MHPWRSVLVACPLARGKVSFVKKIKTTDSAQRQWQWQYWHFTSCTRSHTINEWIPKSDHHDWVSPEEILSGDMCRLGLLGDLSSQFVGRQQCQQWPCDESDCARSKKAPRHQEGRRVAANSSFFSIRIIKKGSNLLYGSLHLDSEKFATIRRN